MSPKENVKKESKFTRGEKCVFVHLVVTFALILALVLVYFAHLLRVPHAAAGGALRVARRFCTPAPVPPKPAATAGGAAAWQRRAGLVRVRGRVACGALLLAARWAAAPAHCVAAHSRPDLASDLPVWRISYRRDDLFVDTDIVRGVVHSHFNGDDFSHNIGLFEHDPAFWLDTDLTTSSVSAEVLQRHAHVVAVVQWDDVAGVEGPVREPVQPMLSETCRQYMVPIVDLSKRSYEFCVRSAKENFTIYHGALVVIGQEIQGLVAWGDKNGNLPLVALDLSYYRNWIIQAIRTHWPNQSSVITIV